MAMIIIIQILTAVNNGLPTVGYLHNTLSAVKH